MIDQVALTIQLLQTATVAVQIKQRMEAPTKRIEVTKELSIQLQEKTEEELTEALIPFFEKQVESMASRLSGMGSIGDDPEKVSKQIFTPSAWDRELVDITLPILAVKSVEAAVTYFQTMGLDVTGGKLQERALKRRRMRSKGRLGTGSVNHPYRFRRPQTKATTATEWLESHSDDWDELVGAVEAAGLPTQLMTEIPPWMQASIAENLTESFEQPYWATINETSGGHAEAVLREGLSSGWSIRRMADSMRAGSEGYSRFRATNIARTESGGALNAARKGSVDALQEEIPEVLMPQFWLSVCGNTTRPEHCALNNVQENEEKLWNLAGYLVPWPGHFSLPANQRANCQCTVYAELGIGTEQAQGAIDGIGIEAGIGEQPVETVGVWGEGDDRTFSGLNVFPEGLRANERLVTNWVDNDRKMGLAIDHYTGIGFGEVNKVLRKGKFIEERINKTIKQLDKLIDNKLEKPVAVYRMAGLRTGPKSLIKAERILQSGGEFPLDKAFGSTSIDPKKMVGFLPVRDGVVWQIKAKSGGYLGGISLHKEEREFLLPRDSKFRVLGIDRNVLLKGDAVSTKVTVIRLEQI